MQCWPSTTSGPRLMTNNGSYPSPHTLNGVRGMGCPLKPLEALVLIVARLRDAAREAERLPLQRELTRIADELLAIREGIMESDTEPVVSSQRTPAYDRNARTRAKNPRSGFRQCSKCRSLLPVEMFTITDARSGKRRADCKACYNEGQRTRYVRAGYKIVTVEVPDGDPCVGHPCSICGEPFEVGQHIQGNNLQHEGCHQ